MLSEMRALMLNVVLLQRLRRVELHSSSPEILWVKHKHALLSSAEAEPHHLCQTPFTLSMMV